MTTSEEEEKQPETKIEDDLKKNLKWKTTSKKDEPINQNQQNWL